MGEHKETFVGYIIGDDTEAFLALVRGDPDYVGRLIWAHGPGLAQVFKTRAEAERIVAAWRRPDEDWCICRLWDRGEQWLVDWDWEGEEQDSP